MSANPGGFGWPGTVTFQASATVSSHQAESGIRHGIALLLRDTADRLEAGQYVVPKDGELGMIGEVVSRVVHTYKGEGLTACGLEVVGPCPDCERAT